MRFVGWLLWLVAAYLYGSVSYALIITRLRTGKDIRALGNRNAGAANVGRNLGIGWGAVVLILDVSKSFIPMLGARLTLGAPTDIWRMGALLTVGMAAFVGHCRPIYFGFRGGRGIATSIGIYAWFVPVELLAAMLTGFLLVLLVVRNVPHRIGPYTPIAFVTLTPFFTLIANACANVRLPIPLRLGGHPWYIVVGVFVLSLFILATNVSFMRERSAELHGSHSRDGVSRRR